MVVTVKKHCDRDSGGELAVSECANCVSFSARSGAVVWHQNVGARSGLNAGDAHELSAKVKMGVRECDGALKSRVWEPSSPRTWETGILRFEIQILVAPGCFRGGWFCSWRGFPARNPVEKSSKPRIFVEVRQSVTVTLLLHRLRAAVHDVRCCLPPFCIRRDLHHSAPSIYMLCSIPAKAFDHATLDADCLPLLAICLATTVHDANTTVLAEIAV